LEDPRIDGIGSLAIGLLLTGISAFLTRESKSLLMGEPAYLFIRQSILSIANSQPGCSRANGLLTFQLGPEQVVAMLSVEFADSMRAPDIEEAVIRLDNSVRAANPEIVAMFVKPRTVKTFQDQRDKVAENGRAAYAESNEVRWTKASR
jgi:divalent metal cation (Fe/Co/Zn/Cd) transporter